MNAFSGANQLPFRTVGDYLDAGTAAKGQILQITNIGRKTAKEFDTLINDFVNAGEFQNSNFETRVGNDIHIAEKTRVIIIDLFSNLHFPQLLLNETLSVRLRNVLINAFPSSRPMSEILIDLPQFLFDFGHFPNAGHRSVEELLEKFSSLFDQFLHLAGLNKIEVKIARSLVFGGAVANTDDIQKLQALSIRFRWFSEDDLNLILPEMDTDSVVNVLLEELSERDRDVLKRRWAIEQDSIETLEEISETYGVTRERIRQIQARATRKLSTQKAKALLQASLERESDRIWDNISDGIPFVSDDQLALKQRLSGRQLLAITIVYGNLRNWLSTIATIWGQGWANSDFTLAELSVANEQIEAALENRPLPVSIVALKSIVNNDITQVAINLSKNFQIHDGYIFSPDGRIGPRKARTVGLHSLLVNHGRLMETRALLKYYHANFPNDTCSVRDAEICMIEASHLFAKISDLRWYGLGEAVPISSEQSDAFEDIDSHISEEIPDKVPMKGIADALQKIFEKFGPQRLVDTYELYKHLLPPNSSINSVGPILLTSGRFIRLLPGIYGLPVQVPNPKKILQSTPDYLLSDRQIRYYTVARASGELFGSYVLWRPETEYIWCCWAEHNTEDALFQSLLSVSLPKLWPVKEQVRERWCALRHSKGRYLLASPCKYPLAKLWPSLASVFHACVLAQHEGRISWISANRVIGKRIDTHISAGLMCVLVALGALKNAQNWQSEHKPGDRITEVISEAEIELQMSGQLQWSSPIGRHFLEFLKSTPELHSEGWVTRNILDELLSGSTDKNMNELGEIEDEELVQSNLDRLLEERKMGGRQNAIENTLHSLLQSGES